MIAPPKTFAPAAVRPRRTLVKIGLICSAMIADWFSPAVPYMQHVAILHDVILAFEAELALGASVGFGPGF
jgi:hypothetical protein